MADHTHAALWLAHSPFSKSQAVLECVLKIKLLQPGEVLDTNLIIGGHIGTEWFVTFTALGKAGGRR